MRVVFNNEAVMLVCAAMAKSRGIDINFSRPWTPDSLEDEIHREACRVIVAFRNKYGCEKD